MKNQLDVEVDALIIEINDLHPELGQILDKLKDELTESIANKEVHIVELINLFVWIIKFLRYVKKIQKKRSES